MHLVTQGVKHESLSVESRNVFYIIIGLSSTFFYSMKIYFYYMEFIQAVGIVVAGFIPADSTSLTS